VLAKFQQYDRSEVEALSVGGKHFAAPALISTLQTMAPMKTLLIIAAVLALPLAAQAAS
jgi:hypothetical protein